MALVSNQSLTPTRLDPNAHFTPSNYPDRRSVIAAFKRAVQMTLAVPEERTALFGALREFHSSLIVEDLMDSLRNILDHPNRRILYKHIRPLIPSRLRSEYNSLVPHIPSFERKVVQIKQTENRQVLGFTIRGGKEFGCGIYVSSISSSSKASQAGLKVGYEIIRINGLILTEVTHEEALNLLKLKKNMLTLVVKVVGLLPELGNDGSKLSWKAVAEPKKWQSSTRLETEAPIVQSTKRIQVNIATGESLGVKIKISRSKEAGVLIVDVTPNSVAHNSGIRAGDEILDVNGKTLVGKTHDEAVRLLKSSDSLMLTIKADVRQSRATSNYNPTEDRDFDFGPQDFDVDAKILSPDAEEDTTFVLRPKDAKQVKKKKTGIQPSPSRDGNLLMLNMDAQQSKALPRLAFPAAEGWGPTIAMPTLLGIGQEATDQTVAMEDSTDLDASVFSMRALSIIEGMQDWQPPILPVSPTTPTSPSSPPPAAEGKEMPASIAKFFPKLPRATIAGEAPPSNQPASEHNRQETHDTTPPKSNEAGKSAQKSPKPDLTSFQFPVDEDDGPPPPPPPSTPPPSSKPRKASPLLPSRKPPGPALKKSPSNSSGKAAATDKRPKFSDNVVIIPDFNGQPRDSSSTENMDTVHPSNLSFSESVLKGRKVQFHTVPKDGPFKVAIRGGTDTPIGGQIIISRIIEGGAAAKYGKLNVGDQILVCDGVSMLDVTHDEAAQAFKRAMDMESNSIDLVVAVNPDI